MDGDIFTQSAASNRRRTYALAGYTVTYRVSGWFYRRTDHDEPYKGPYGNETSVCLMIAKALAKELRKRDGLPS
jgi:hypothetical protein